MNRLPAAYLLAASALLPLACGGDEAGRALYARLTPEATGLEFVNAVPESDSLNILRYEYIYNGGGVAVEDFDGNGLPDVLLTGNTVSSRLYLQRAPWRFEDVTERAGLTTEVWCAGVSLADADGDGDTDVYLATLDLAGRRTTPNLLFLREGNSPTGVPQFREAAAEFGLADSSYSTHAAWFDADRDGDLDVYLLNNAIEDQARNTPRGTDTSGRGLSVDVFYRNDGPSASPRFTRTAFAKTEGWGLGVAAQDFNRDGYPDLYVANDFLSDDLLLVNAGGAGFGDSLKAALPHTSYNAMGVDVADLDGDGWPEIVTADMLPDDNLRRKTMFGDVPHQADAVTERRGYGKQYVRNVLQRNNRDGTFSDVALAAGAAATDWSWAPLLADLDNDGDRDLFVTNGYPKDITDKDFADYTAAATRFGTEESQLTTVSEALAEVGGVHQPDFFFRNEGELRFADVSDDWGDGRATYANGAAFADLDGDGDLDLVTNNINEPAGLYRNLSRERDTSSTHYLRIALEGPPGNPGGIGARVYLRAGELLVAHEHHRQRGYLSTVEPEVHVGLGERTRVDTLLVIWPDGRRSLRTDLAADQHVRVDHEGASAPLPLSGASPTWSRAPAAQWHAVPADDAPRHRESAARDFDRAALALRDHSRAGPSLATLDLDGDGRDELVVGGAAGQATRVYSYRGGVFAHAQDLPATLAGEAVALLTADFDGDGDDDLVVGNGSSEFGPGAGELRDLAYRNEGGTLVLASEVLPNALTPVPTSTLASGDVDGDGDLDLFAGTRMRAGRYPESAPSRLFINERGLFRLAREMPLGMVTDGLFADFDGDGLADLATVGEYEPLRIQRGSPGPQGLSAPWAHANTSGWWYSLSVADLDGDGDEDLLAGNVGLNANVRASPERPLRVRVDDVDGNGDLDPITTAYLGDEAVPVHPRNTLARQLPRLKSQIPSYRDYAAWTEGRLPPVSEDGFVLEAVELASAMFVNDGRGGFAMKRLPARGQDAPIRDAVAVALQGGGVGLLAVQNDYAVEPLGGRLDAGTGLLVRLDSVGAVRVDGDHWSLREDARSVARLGDDVVVGVNDGQVRVFREASSHGQSRGETPRRPRESALRASE